MAQDEKPRSMNTAQTPPGSAPGTGPTAAPSGDPSMEDILASIRRILREDKVAPASTAGPSAFAGRRSVGKAAPFDQQAAGSDVLVLDSAMIVPEPQQHVDPVPEPVTQDPPAATVITPQALVAPEAAAVAGSAVDVLVRTLVAERTMQVRSGGPTIEDIVREELRPLLKVWLDANLPPLVERLVRVEIERVVGRAVP
jgi:uncharacterized protein